MLGILLIDKPLGITSHDAVNAIRRKLGTKRVGHAGTLDPLASGLLVVAVGPATRFLQYLSLEPKEYEGTITFGKRTSTFDAEGEVTEAREVPSDLDSRLKTAATQFTGLIEQLPPMYSAVKKAGKPLYKYAREGQEVERQARTVHISQLEIELTDAAVARFRLVCSGGTYVRTLADDLGQAVGCGAFLSELRRTKVGRFTLGQSHPLETAKRADLMPLREALAPMPMVQLTQLQTDAVREGQQVFVPEVIRPGIVALKDPHGEVFSVARLLGNLLQPECVIPSEAFDGSL